MSNLTQAGIFGDFFCMLATWQEDHPDEAPTIKALAMQAWEQSKLYDFSPLQMQCDDALVELGLAVYMYSDNAQRTIYLRR